jgi:DNA modification methylase
MKQVNNCTLYHGDCLKVLSKIKDNSISLVISDPPYWHNKGHGLVYRAGSRTKLKTDLYMAQNDMMGKFSTFTPKNSEFFERINKSYEIDELLLFL